MGSKTIVTHDVLSCSRRFSPLRKALSGNFCLKSIDDARLPYQTGISKWLKLTRERISLVHSARISLDENIRHPHERLIEMMATREYLPFAKNPENKDIFYSVRLSC